MGDSSGDRRPDDAKDRDDHKPDQARPADIRPVPKKIGEDDDNLKRREKWFRRRTGSSDDQA